MSFVLEELEPKRVFYYFENICNIPHGSYHIEDLAQYLVSVAKELDLWVEMDEFCNVLIKKPASKGYENAPTLILQGHMDMVCEKEEGCSHDFLKDGLALEIGADCVYAKGTTLGGDDGIALAYGLAILEDSTIKHPPLEVLFTTQEEVGMDGAIGFDASKVVGNYLLNLDSEEEGVVLISSAGGLSVELTRELKKEPVAGIPYEVKIWGLEGGHSGANIHLGKANANVLLGRVLSNLEEEYKIRVAYVKGGSKHNAIPQQAEAVLFLEGDNASRAFEIIKEEEESFQKEYKTVENGIRVSICPAKDTWKEGYTKELSRDVISLMYQAPDGVNAMSNEIAGFVESSRNYAIVEEKEGCIAFLFSLRSQQQEGITQMKTELELMGAKMGFDVTADSWYPSWEYQPDSKLRELLLDCYRNQYQKEMKVEAIHAGLECGILASKKELDIISIGPDILDIHTPRERLMIASTRRTYQLLLALLARGNELPV